MRRSLIALALALSLGATAASAHEEPGGSISKVNGGITAEAGQQYGDLETVNGGITIKQTQVGGQVHTVSGDVTIGAKSVVRGGIWVERPHGISFGRQRIPRIVIGPDATVQGTLRFDREVELFVHPSAKIGTVTGAKVQSWTTTLPPRKD